MKKNRLNLDFSIESSNDRAEFVQQYMKSIDFEPDEAELETIANYVLYGKDSDGKSMVQRHEIEIETRYKTWQKQEIESLEELRESPTFNEAVIKTPSTEIAARPKVVKETFSRAKALSKSDGIIKEELQDLFNRIDSIDLECTFYDLAHGKRKEPPRDDLLSKFTEEEIASLKEKSTHLQQWKYLKLRHYLVELRKQQFTIGDSYSNPVLMHETRGDFWGRENSTFGTDVEVYPIGIGTTAQTTFCDEQQLVTKKWTEEELSAISKLCWREPKENELYFDFRELEHVYNFFLLIFEMQGAPENGEVESNVEELLRALKFYVDFANLTDLQAEILDMKMKRIKNQDIADYVNEKYGKSYTANYISTIFRQKIIKQINDAATYHLEVLRNLAFPENFCKCNTCGQILLLDTRNYVRKARSKTGFSHRCKACDRIEREKKKGETK